MKIENLERAAFLKEKLRQVNVQLDSVTKGTHLLVCGEFKVSSKNFDYGATFLEDTVKPVFIRELTKNKEEIIEEIEKL